MFKICETQSEVRSKATTNLTCVAGTIFHIVYDQVTISYTITKCQHRVLVESLKLTIIVVLFTFV